MRLCASIALTAALLAASVLGGTTPADTRWRTVAVPWNRTLPAVEVALGYADAYVPVGNFPVEIRATASAAPFDGAIGYRFVVGRSKTRDIPVLARAVIAAGQTWSYSTVGQMRIDEWVSGYDSFGSATGGSNRELVILWFDRSLKPVAQRNVGKVPWTRRRDMRALRIVRPGEVPAAATLLGQKPVIASAESLPLEAQWYRGFQAVIAPLDLWLDLPMALRQTIFSCPIRVAFFGLPRSGQQLTDLDRALLPIELIAAAGQVAIPASYRTGRTSMSLPMSWRPKRGSSFAGSRSSPYLVSNAVASFAAEESALTAALPRWPGDRPDRWSSNSRTVNDRWRLFLRDSRSLATLLLSVALSAVTWFLVKKNRIRTALLVAIVSAASALAFRNSVRPHSGQSIEETRHWVAPGVIIHEWSEHLFGTAPLPSAILSRDTQRSWSTAGPLMVRQTAELRPPNVLPGHGAMYADAAWDTSARMRSRRELAPEPDVRARRSADGVILTIGDSVPARYAIVGWVANDRLARGEVPVRTRGEIPIRDTDSLPDTELVWSWRHRIYTSEWGRSSVRAQLVDPREWRTNVLSLELPLGEVEPRADWGVGGTMDRENDGNWSMTIVVPQTTPEDDGREVVIGLTEAKTVRSAKLTGSNGTVDVFTPPFRSVPPSTAGQQAWAIPLSRLSSIAAPGDVVRMDVTAETAGEELFASIRTRRRPR